MTTFVVVSALILLAVTLVFWRLRQWSLSMTLYMMMVVGVALFFVAVVVKDNRDTKRIGRSDLTLCLKFTKPIEITQRRALTTLPTLAYYKEHPEELRDQISQIKAMLHSFASATCYELPSVKEAGLKPPTKKGGQ